MKEVRIGVIGCGGMAQAHMNNFKDVPRLKFTAASDVVAANVQKVVETYGVTGFDDGHKLLESGLVDAVLIATPHYFHPEYAKAALEKGIHVLTEKPVAVTAKAAAEVDAVAAKNPHLKYAAMFQMRTNPKYIRAKKLIESGELGELRRVTWIATAWFRSQAYYDSGSWRATWKGEGGGVLLNQCPHNLDLMYWLAGKPTQIIAQVELGKYHKIEVEDDVSAYFRYANGATGTFVASTGEAPGTDFFEIVGDRGRLMLSGSHLELFQTDVSVKEFTYKSPNRFGGPPVTRMVIETPAGGHHREIMVNFVEAILDGKPLIAPGTDGTASVEMINAMIMSGLEHRPIDLPMDRDAYEAKLAELIAKSPKK